MKLGGVACPDVLTGLSAVTQARALTPTTTKPAPPAGELLKRGAVRALVNMSAFIAFTAPWNLTGQPAISVPAGHDHTGVPLGAQLVARPGREDVLLYLATQLEVNKTPKRTHLT